jgi:hypothetical protein
MGAGEKLWDGFVSIDGHEVSDHCTKGQVTLGKEVFDMSHFGSGAKLRDAIGVEDHSFDFEFLENMAANKIGAIRLAMWQSGGAKTVLFRLDKTNPASAANPEFSIPCILDGGKVSFGGSWSQQQRVPLRLISSGVVTIGIGA